MIREFNAEYANTVLNDPAVIKGSRAAPGSDLSALVADLNNVLLTYDGGAFLCVNKGSGGAAWRPDCPAPHPGLRASLRTRRLGSLNVLIHPRDTR